jgi:hypothetical protein
MPIKGRIKKLNNVITHKLAMLGRWVALTVSFVPSAENPKMALNTPTDPTTEHTMIIVLSIAMFHQRTRERWIEAQPLAIRSTPVYVCLYIESLAQLVDTFYLQRSLVDGETHD